MTQPKDNYIKIKRSKFKQLTFRGTLYSLVPGQLPKLNKIEKLNQTKTVQNILKRLGISDA